MQFSVLRGLAENIKENARRIFKLAYEPLILENKQNSEVIIEVLPANKLRKLPLRIILTKSYKIIVSGILPDFEKVRHIVSTQVSNFIRRLESFEDILEAKIPDGSESNSLCFEVKYKETIRFDVLEEIFNEIFSFIKEVIKRVMIENHDYSLENFGAFSISILSDIFTLIPRPLEQIINDLKKAWFPGKIITATNGSGVFLNGEIGLDFMNFPLLSTVSKNGDKLEHYMYLINAPKNIKVVPLEELMRVFMSSLEILEKYLDERVILNIKNRVARNPRLLAENLALWDSLIDLANKISSIPTEPDFTSEIANMRPHFLRPRMNIEKKRIDLAEEDLRELHNVSIKLAQYRNLLYAIHLESSIFEEMVIGRILSRILSKSKKPIILFGEEEKRIEKRPRKTKNGYSLTITSKEVDIKKFTNKVSIRVINTNKKKLLLIEVDA